MEQHELLDIALLMAHIEDKLLQCDDYQLRELVDAGAIGETMRLWIEQVREKRLH